MRDNSKRLAAAHEAPPPASMSDGQIGLDFATPTELVDLPSGGKLYPPGHALHGCDTVEIKFMTAKDEDILTSPSLLKKGLAIDRFIQNVIVDKRIRVPSLLTGDKNAIVVASRINGFGSDYTTKMTCPSCMQVSETTFDLDQITVYSGDDFRDYDITLTDRGTHVIILPRSKFKCEVKLLTSRDEAELTAPVSGSKKLTEAKLTDQMKKIIISINDVEDREVLSRAVDALPASDSRYLRAAYLRVVPGLNMTQEFHCPSCEFEKEVDIPLTADFFWSNE